MITYNALIVSLLLAINPNNLGSNGVWNNNFSFNFYTPLRSTSCVDGNNPCIINSSMRVEGLLQFNDDINGAINVQFQEWTFSYEIFECEYDSVYDSYYYQSVDYFTSRFTYNYSTSFNYDGYIFDNMDFFHINYYFDVHDDDLYQNVAFYTEEQGGQLDYINSTTGGQGYSTYTKFSNGTDLSFNTDYLYYQIVNFLNDYVNGGVDYERGYRDGSRDGYETGYQNGLTDGANMDETTLAVWNGILSIGLVPINFFLAIFNFEVLGINITTFVMSLLSVCIVIILLRLVFGGKSSASGD